MTMIWALALMVIVAALVTSGSDDLRALDTVTRAEFTAEAQARGVAEAGLVDAYAWFRRQTVQPVTGFAPRLDPAAVPPVNDTENPAKGLVRSFEISPNLWARYSVRLGVAGEAFTDADWNGHYDLGESFEDLDGDGRCDPPMGTRDITSERGLAGTGIVWRLECLGQIFSRPRADLPLDDAPNRIVGSVLLATEIQRLPIMPPIASAIYCRRGDNAAILGRSRIRAPETALGYAESTGVPFVDGSSEVLAATTAAPVAGDRLVDVFGANLTDLRSMADMATTAADTLPIPLPPYSLVVVDGDATFDAARPLQGSGVLVVTGDLHLKSGSNSYYSGVVYVQGEIRIGAPAYVRGQILAMDRLRLEGGAGDFVEVEHDPGVVERLLGKMGHYRYSRGIFRPLPYHVDGRPDEGFEGRGRTGVGGGSGADKNNLKTWYRDHTDTHPLLTEALERIYGIVDANLGTPLGRHMASTHRLVLDALKKLLETPPDTVTADDKLRRAIDRVDDAVDDYGLEPSEGQQIIDLLQSTRDGL